jgi:hypothetical protein
MALFDSPVWHMVPASGIRNHKTLNLQQYIKVLYLAAFKEA